MSFTWAESITAGVTTVKASHVAELRTNINTVRGKVGLGNYSWVKTITQYVTPVAASEWLELRTALDAADTANVCSVDNVTQNSTNYVTHLSSDLTNYDASYCSVADSGACPGNLASDDGGDNFSNYTSYHVYCTSHYTSYWSANDVGHYAANYAYCNTNYGQDWWD